MDRIFVTKAQASGVKTRSCSSGGVEEVIRNVAGVKRPPFGMTA